MLDYKKENIIKVYYTISVLDDCGNEYEELSERQCPQDLVGACKKVVEMIKDDRELGEEYGRWFYLVVKHEEDAENDWQTFYKVFKYRGRWKCKATDYNDFCSSVLKSTIRRVNKL